ncbi:MAG: glycosyltransferase [Methylophilaceae bacterium]|nr:MAG: glycosyltransferase [Methylophilaceae bacterium]
MRLIQSLAKQSYVDWELLISDGGSTDGTAEYIATLPVGTVKSFDSRPDSGIYNALNRALRQATGEWVLVLGADDSLVSAASLEDLYLKIKSVSPTVRLCYGDIEIQGKNHVFKKHYPDFQEFTRKYGKFPPIHHQSMLIRREEMLLKGGFSEAYRIHSDYHLMCQILTDSVAVKIECVVARFGEFGYSGSVKNVVRSIVEIYRIRKSFGVDPFERDWKQRYLIQITHGLVRILLPTAAVEKIKYFYRSIIK